MVVTSMNVLSLRDYKFLSLKPLVSGEYIAHCTKAIVEVTLKCIYLFFIIEIFQHNTHRLIYFEGLET